MLTPIILKRAKGTRGGLGSVASTLVFVLFFFPFMKVLHKVLVIGMFQCLVIF